MDDFAFEALDFRLKILESKLDGLQGESFSVTIRRLRSDLNKLGELGRLIDNLKNLNEYFDIPVDPNSDLLKDFPDINEDMSIEDKKLVILSQGQQFSKFLAAVEHIESLVNVLEKFKATHAEISRVKLEMNISPMNILEQYDTRIYSQYCKGVQKCFHLLELDISNTYEQNLFLVEVQERLKKLSDKLPEDNSPGNSSPNTTQ